MGRLLTRNKGGEERRRHEVSSEDFEILRSAPRNHGLGEFGAFGADLARDVFINSYLKCTHCTVRESNLVSDLLPLIRFVLLVTHLI